MIQGIQKRLIPIWNKSWKTKTFNFFFFLTITIKKNYHKLRTNRVMIFEPGIERPAHIPISVGFSMEEVRNSHKIPVVCNLVCNFPKQLKPFKMLLLNYFKNSIDFMPCCLHRNSICLQRKTWYIASYQRISIER